MKTYFLYFLILSFSICSCTIRTSKNGEEMTIDFDGQKFSQALEEANSALLKSELGCDYVMKNTGLDSLLEELDGTWFAANKLEEVKNQIKDKNACLNVYHVVSIIESIPETDRFEFARFAYGRTVDRTDFHKVKAYLNDENEKAKLEAIYKEGIKKISEGTLTLSENLEGNDTYKQTIKIDGKEIEAMLDELIVELESEIEVEETRTTNDKTITSSCTNPTLNDEEFEKIAAYIYEGHMASDKLKRAKGVANKRCLTVIQIRDIIDIINFPTEQVLFAKYAFTRTTDPQNYCDVKKSVFATEKGKITEFCKRKGLNCGTSKMEKMMDSFQ